MIFCVRNYGDIRNLCNLIKTFILSFGLFFGICLLLFACSSGTKGEQGPAKGIPVMVGSVIQKNVPVQIRVIGTVEAYSVVSVKTVVGGELVRVYFTEGQDVNKGDPLFLIDPRPFEAALKQAEANLARDMAQIKQAEAELVKNTALVKQAEGNLERDMAQAKNAEADAQRYRLLSEKKVVAEQQYNQFRTNSEALEATVRAGGAALESAKAAVRASQAAVENAEAAVRADKAAVENARIQLGYCSIRSPMDGRTGHLMVKQGNVVKANDIVLVVINQIRPISVSFSVPEQNLSEIRKYMAIRKLGVEAVLPNDWKGPEQGILAFVDNAVDSATGTIRMKGTFANRENSLWPGQFVNVILTLTEELNAIVVPSQAVQTGQDGQYVFVVKPDLTVESRSVVVSRTLHHETVVQKGLHPGETVVTDGQIRLSSGILVETKTPDQPPTPTGKAQ
jgi:membrane fusion protein, multidrug efflux system